jgi:hypothetical protein
MCDDDLNARRLRKRLIEKDLCVLPAEIGPAARPHMKQHWGFQAFEQGEHLANSRRVRWIAQADATIAQVQLQPNHAAQTEAALDLGQRFITQRVDATKADQPSAAGRHLLGGSIILDARQEVGIVQSLALIGEGVTHRQDHRAVNARRIQSRNRGHTVHGAKAGLTSPQGEDPPRREGDRQERAVA